jgi:hypothetical protein
VRNTRIENNNSQLDLFYEKVECVKSGKLLNPDEHLLRILKQICSILGGFKFNAGRNNFKRSLYPKKVLITRYSELDSKHP